MALSNRGKTVKLKLKYDVNSPFSCEILVYYGNFSTFKMWLSYSLTVTEHSFNLSETAEIKEKSFEIEEDDEDIIHFEIDASE